MGDIALVPCGSWRRDSETRAQVDAAGGIAAYLLGLGAAAVTAEATEGPFTSLTVDEADATADATAEEVQLGADEGNDAYDPESWEGEDDSYESDF